MSNYQAKKELNGWALAAGLLILADVIYSYLRVYSDLQEQEQAATIAIMALSSFYRSMLSYLILSSACCFYSFWQKKNSVLVVALGFLLCSFINLPPNSDIMWEYAVMGLTSLVAIGAGIDIDRSARKNNRKEIE